MAGILNKVYSLSCRLDGVSSKPDFWIMCCSLYEMRLQGMEI